jgi:hypothetical protein
MKKIDLIFVFVGLREWGCECEDGRNIYVKIYNRYR